MKEKNRIILKTLHPKRQGKSCKNIDVNLCVDAISKHNKGVDHSGRE